MKKKYIIALEDRNVWSCGFPAKTLLLSDVSILGTDLASVNTGIELTPYTEPDLEKVRKEAYDKGYHEGHNACFENAKDLMEEKKNEAYQRGLADAWEAARKIACDEGIDMNTLCTIFRRGSSVSIIRDYSASEAIAKIKEYEDGKQEIKVGDEVATDAGNRASVLYENPDGTQVFVFKSDGTAAWWTKSALHRTGRNFPEISSVLEKMRGEQE